MGSAGRPFSEDLLRAGWRSRGYLPHFEGGEIAQAITFRLHDSLPRPVLARWRQELLRRQPAEVEEVLRRRIEVYLDRGYGCAQLRDARAAALVMNALLHFDGMRYRLSAWVVMPNHVHLLATPCAGHTLARIMHSLKSYTSQEVNKLFGRAGKLWMEDYFDRYVRDARHFTQAVTYIEHNPVKAGLCKAPHEWPFSSASLR